jgi:hypothetical protein
MGIFNRHTNWPTLIEDIPGAWGLAFRTGAVAIAVLMILFFAAKRDLSRPEVTMGLRVIVIFEAAYFASFLAAGLNVYKRDFFTLPRILDQALPCIVQSILISAVLIKLFLALNPNKATVEAKKWALIYGASFLLVFWLNNTGYWLGTLVVKGADYVTAYPINLLSFLVTTVGLLLLTLYGANLTRKYLNESAIRKIDLEKVGTIMTALGLYPMLIFLLYLFFGAVGGWSSWYAWFLGHGYMTFVAFPLPFVGLPLLFRCISTNQRINPASELGRSFLLKKKTLSTLTYLTQSLGTIFFIVFSLVYYIPLPSTQVLTGEPIFHSLLQIFGVLYFGFTIAVLTLFFVSKRENTHK